MAGNRVNLEEWRELYKQMMRVREIAPWQWMEEIDIFGIQNPETDEFGFVSVMGTLGEHYAVAVYLGAKGLYGFWQLAQNDPNYVSGHVLEVPQLQASFEDRKELHKKDREIIKQLKLKFRGRQEWPLFRSFRVGYFPWFLEAEEVRFLTHALAQTIEVGLRFKEDPSLLDPPDDETYLVRVPNRENDTLQWQDQMIKVPPPPPASIELSMDTRLLAQLKSVQQRIAPVEIDLSLMPIPIEEKRGERPFYPYILLVVVAQADFILGSELMQAIPSLEAMWGAIPEKLVETLARTQSLPVEIRVRSELLYQLLAPVTEELEIALNLTNDLPALDSAREFMMQRMV